MKYAKTNKLYFCSPNIWKKIFLFKKNSMFKINEKFFYNRSSVIPGIYRDSNVFIYSGHIWHTRFVTRWMVGFKFGEFTWNRKLALYKAKQLKKLKKKNK